MLLGFSILLALTIIVGIMGAVTTNSISNSNVKSFNENVKPLSDLEDITVHFNQMRIILVKAYIVGETGGDVMAVHTSYASLRDDVLSAITGYANILNEQEDSQRKTEAMNNLDRAMSTFSSYDKEAEEVFRLILGGEIERASNVINSDIYPALAESFNNAAIGLFNNSLNEATRINGISAEKARFMTVLILGVTTAAILITVIVAVVITKAIAPPVRAVSAALNEVANGNLNINLNRESQDELGFLVRDTRRVAETFSLVMAEFERVSNEMQAGDIDARADSSRFTGSYKAVVDGFNKTMDGIINEVGLLISVNQEFGKGNFDVFVPNLPGKKAAVNESVDMLKVNFSSIISDIRYLVRNVSDGNLNAHVNASKYEGGWKNIIDEMNELMFSIAEPISLATEAITEMSRGNLSVRITKELVGEYDTIKRAINFTQESVSSYIEEIREVLSKMSNQNFDVGIRREYLGDFTEIRDAINMIIADFNRTMADINASAEQVAMGARQISESSMSLSQGSTEQASAVEELNATIESIAEKTKAAAQTAQEANKLSEDAKANATRGQSEMEQMLTAMNEINDASNNISRIIKVIQDIASQTNLLALNAAVEAARAGEHGRGFTVVAEQVRSLASRSQEAAKNTTDLIEGSVKKAAYGTKIANETANALNVIVEQITGVSALVGEISDSAAQQAESIQQINLGIGQIAQVTQSNTATSEEEAAAAQELSSQAEVFRNMVGGFKLKKI